MFDSSQLGTRSFLQCDQRTPGGHLCPAHEASEPPCALLRSASWFSSCDYCAAERDSPTLACVPLTQARIAAITYYGPTVTCQSNCTAGNAGPQGGGTCTPCGAGKYSSWRQLLGRSAATTAMPVSTRPCPACALCCARSRARSQ
jgi:hypothetical protein